MLLAGRPGAAQNSHLAPAVLHALERFTVHSLDSAVLFGVSSTSPEEACAQVTLIGLNLQISLSLSSGCNQTGAPDKIRVTGGFQFGPEMTRNC